MQFSFGTILNILKALEGKSFKNERTYIVTKIREFDCERLLEEIIQRNYSGGPRYLFDDIRKDLIYLKRFI